LATLLTAKSDFSGAEKELRDAAEIYRRAFGDSHATYGNALSNLALPIELQGRLDEAERLLADALRITQSQLDDENPRVLTIMVNQARVQIARGRGASTEMALRHVLAVRQRTLAEGHWQIGQAQSLLGAALLAGRHSAEAEPLMVAADAVLKPVPGVQDRERLANRARLIALYQRSGRSKDAAAFR
jgi:tetratricopeptide (TPR) repeat protein